VDVALSLGNLKHTDVSSLLDFKGRFKVNVLNGQTHFTTSCGGFTDDQ